jgi:hypothetical protein
LLDKPRAVADPRSNASSADEGDGSDRIVLVTASGVSFVRGVIHGTLICLCFWIPLAVAAVLLLT